MNTLIDLGTVTGSAEAITVPVARAHCHVFHNDDDPDLARLIVAARERLEIQADGKRVRDRSVRLLLPKFPTWSIRLEGSPLISVSAIKYLDADGAEQTITASEYVVSQATQPGRVEPAYGESWPTTREHPEAVRIEYSLGYGSAAAVPSIAIQAMLLMIGHWYANREEVVAGTIATAVPNTANDLAAMFAAGDYR